MDILSLQCRIIDLTAVTDLLSRDLPESHSLLRSARDALQNGGHDEIAACWAEVMALASLGTPRVPASRTKSRRKGVKQRPAMPDRAR